MSVKAKVYYMNDHDIVLAPSGYEVAAVNAWYENFIDDENDINEIELMDPEKEGFWCETDWSKDTPKEVIKDITKDSFGDIRLFGGVYMMYVSLKEIIKLFEDDLEEPMILCSNEV